MTARAPARIDGFTSASTSEERASVRRDLHENADRRMVVMDELREGVPLTSPVTHSVLSDGVISLRGRTRPFWAVLALVGVRVRPSAPLAKRVMTIELLPQRGELPRKRRDLLRATVAERPTLIRAALTMLCGRDELLARNLSPEFLGRPCGDWPEWRRLVQGAVIDAGGEDVATLWHETRADVERESREAEVLDQLVAYQRGRNDQSLTAAGIAADAERTRASAEGPIAEWPELRRVLRRWIYRDESIPISVRRLAPRLNSLAGQVIDGKRLQCLPHPTKGDKRAAIYRIEEVDDGSPEARPFAD
jgi:hypothetical protein